MSDLSTANPLSTVKDILSFSGEPVIRQCATRYNEFITFFYALLPVFKKASRNNTQKNYLFFVHIFKLSDNFGIFDKLSDNFGFFDKLSENSSAAKKLSELSENLKI